MAAAPLSSPGTTARLSALDGLRGVAALIVVVHHCLLVSPALAAAYYGGAVGGVLQRIAVYSPLHLLWGGAEAVVVFFVLSGVVLSHAIASARFSWASYFPSRLLRLYVPVAGAVAFGLLVITRLPSAPATSSPWLARDAGYPFADVLRDLTLIGGTSGVISPLWTLRWEILFSLLLPVFAYSVRLLPAWAFGVMCVALSTIGAATDVASLQYLPIFGVGMALAAEWERMRRVIHDLRPSSAVAVWIFVSMAVVAMLSSSWWMRTFVPRELAAALAQAPIVVGAAALVFAAANCPPLGRLLRLRAIAWLGTISFSLYLVHEPIVIAASHLTGSARYTLVLAVPTALAVAWLFWWIVERPAHHLARRVRDSVFEKDAIRSTVTSAPRQTSERELAGATRR